jgi:hypothetical protein
MARYRVFRRAVVEEVWIVEAASKAEAKADCTMGELLHANEEKVSYPKVEEIRGE